MRALVPASIAGRVDAGVEAAVGVEYRRQTDPQHERRRRASRQELLGHRVKLIAGEVSGHKRKRVGAEVETICVESDQRLVAETRAAHSMRRGMEPEQVPGPCG